jgi:hypothetical protein
MLQKTERKKISAGKPKGLATEEMRGICIRKDRPNDFKTVNLPFRQPNQGLLTTLSLEPQGTS